MSRNIPKTLSKSLVFLNDLSSGIITKYKFCNYFKGKWSEKPGSNRRPQPWQGYALPTELFSLVVLLKELFQRLSMQ